MHYTVIISKNIFINPLFSVLFIFLIYIKYEKVTTWKEKSEQ